MLRSKTFLFIAVALTSSQANAFVVAYDDTADAAYSSGWALFSNGGYGFGVWAFSQVSTQGIADSNSNGSLGGPGINVAGKSWQSQQGIGWGGAMTSRNLGSFTVGNLFEIDADFGDLSVGSQQVNILDGSLTDFIQVRSYGGSAFMQIQSTFSNITTNVAYSDGGFRLGFAYTSASNVDVSITTLATNTTSTYSVIYTGVAGSHELTLGGQLPVAGQELYANRMKMTSPVPEPGTMPRPWIWPSPFNKAP
jgi:hypothetical protein